MFLITGPKNLLYLLLTISNIAKNIEIKVQFHFLRFIKQMQIFTYKVFNILYDVALNNLHYYVNLNLITRLLYIVRKFYSFKWTMAQMNITSL